MAGRIKRLELDADDRFVLRWALLVYRAELRGRDVERTTEADLREREAILARIEDLVQRLA